MIVIIIAMTAIFGLSISYILIYNITDYEIDLPYKILSVLILFISLISIFWGVSEIAEKQNNKQILISKKIIEYRLVKNKAVIFYTGTKIEYKGK